MKFDQFDSDFDKHVSAVRKMAVIGSVVYLVVIAGVLGFVGWVVVKLMQHFGII